MTMPLFLWCCIVVWFSYSFLLVLAFYVLRALGMDLRKRKLNGALGEMNETE